MVIIDRVSFKVVIGDRVSLFKGGSYRQGVLILRWSLETGCHYSEVVLIDRVSLFKGGYWRQDVIILRWLL